MSPQVALLKEANRHRNAWEEVLHFLRMIRVYQSGRAVQHSLAVVERAKHELERAYRAYDHARADLTAHDYPMRNIEVPTHMDLLKPKEDQ